MQGFIQDCKEHPLLFWNLIGLISMIFRAELFWLFFFISLIALVMKQNRDREKEQIRKEELIASAEAFAEKIQEEGRAPTITTTLFLGLGENAFLDEETALIETRAVRANKGGGVGVRVAKGVYVGGYQGTAESSQEWRAIDSGRLVITNEKLVFKGVKQNRVVSIKDILSIDSFSDGIKICTSSRAKNMAFKVENPFIWGTVFTILKSGKDPLRLSGVKINTAFQWNDSSL